MVKQRGIDPLTAIIDRLEDEENYRHDDDNQSKLDAGVSQIRAYFGVLRIKFVEDWFESSDPENR